jgi:DHA1 family bicyclomycin/chloramphenicol resistance-like MFS transporter
LPAPCRGLAGATGLVLARAIIRDIAPAERLAHFYSLMLLVAGCGPISAPLVGSGLLHLMPWRGIFGVLTGLGILIALLVFRGLPESLPGEGRHGGGMDQLGRTFQALRRDRQFASGCVLIGLGCAATFTYISLSSFVLQDGFGLTEFQFGAMVAVNAVGMMTVSRTSAFLLRRHAAGRPLGIGLAAILTSATALSTAATAGAELSVLLPMLFVTISLVYTVFPNATAIAGQRRNAGTASAVLGAFQFATGGLAGPLVSIVAVTATSRAVAMVLWAFAAGVAWLVCSPDATRPRSRGYS